LEATDNCRPIFFTALSPVDLLSLFVSAWALTASLKGDTGRIEGKIIIGAPLLAAPPPDVILGACHVLLFSARGLVSGFVVGGGDTTPSIRPPMNDFRNHEFFFSSVGTPSSMESLDGFIESSAFFLEALDGVADLGRRGSTASRKYSCCSAWIDVGRDRGSHMRHQVTNCANEAGHVGAARIDSMGTGAIYICQPKLRDQLNHAKLTRGKLKPSLPANRVPSRHSPPPIFFPLLPTHCPGEPITSHTLQTWSTSFPPGNSGFKVATSTAIAPTAQMSTGALYSPARRSTSGALYHRVETYVV
jgi:hypothetical protein